MAIDLSACVNELRVLYLKWCIIPRKLELFQNLRKLVLIGVIRTEDIDRREQFDQEWAHDGPRMRNAVGEEQFFEELHNHGKEFHKNWPGVLPLDSLKQCPNLRVIQLQELEIKNLDFLPHNTKKVYLLAINGLRDLRRLTELLHLKKVVINGLPDKESSLGLLTNKNIREPLETIKRMLDFPACDLAIQACFQPSENDELAPPQKRLSKKITPPRKKFKPFS